LILTSEQDEAYRNEEYNTIQKNTLENRGNNIVAGDSSNNSLALRR
jgi:hypothetical protein